MDRGKTWKEHERNMGSPPTMSCFNQVQTSNLVSFLVVSPFVFDSHATSLPGNRSLEVKMYLEDLFSFTDYYFEEAAGF
jgi:hypothetical protein